MKRLCSMLVLLGVAMTALPAPAQKWEESKPEEKKLFWRNSLFTYENIFSAYSLSRAADPTYNPYYAMSMSFRPRFYATEDLSFRPRLDVEVELTLSDDTDHAREWIISDLYLDTVWSPSYLTIPKIDVKVQPSLRLMFPTSIESRGRSMVMNLGPGFSLRRAFELRKGTWFTSLDTGYGFRFTKNFFRYANAQVADLGGCENINRPECQHRGNQNVSWRFTNSLDATLQIHPKIAFGVSLMFINNLLHQIPEQTVELSPGVAVTLPPSRITHTAATWAIFDISYDVLSWMSLSVGTSTYYGQLSPDSGWRTPIFNRYTNFYFDITIPIDALYTQIKTWSRGSSRAPGAQAMKGAPGLLSNSY